jgi:hypothetical protein
MSVSNAFRDDEDDDDEDDDDEDDDDEDDDDFLASVRSDAAPRVTRSVVGITSLLFDSARTSVVVVVGFLLVECAYSGSGSDKDRPSACKSRGGLESYGIPRLAAAIMALKHSATWRACAAEIPLRSGTTSNVAPIFAVAAVAAAAAAAAFVSSPSPFCSSSFSSSSFNSSSSSSSSASDQL